MNDDTLTNID